MIRSITLAAALCLATIAHAQTLVGGVIDTDTTWTAADSPYRVTDTIVVTGNATLTIQTDVEVDFDDGQGMVIGPAGSGGTGELRVLGTGGVFSSGYVFLDGGTGIRFAQNAVSGRVDPDTGEYLDGSILRNARLRYVEPETFSGTRFALNCAGSVPYLDSFAARSIVGGGGIRANISGSGVASVRWNRVDVNDVDGDGVVLAGGVGHVINTLNAVDVRSPGDRGAAFRIEFLSPPSAGQWSVSILGGTFRDIEARAAIGPGIAALRVANTTFERCSTVAVSTTDAQRVELTGCVFQDNLRHAVGDGRATVRGCSFVRSGAARPVDFDSGSLFEDCRFENNVGPVLDSSGLTVRRCDFTGNAAIDGGGAIVGHSLDLFHCTFTRNSAERGGALLAGVVYGYGNTYTANTATYGGAIFFEGRRSLLGREGDPEVFIGNTAIEGGGAIYVDGDAIDLLAAQFERNSAYAGGAIYVSPFGHSLNFSTPGGTSSRVRDNVASIGPAIFVDPPALPFGLVDIDAPCVDWGTRDPLAIAARIYDGADAPGRAVVVFDPIGPCGPPCPADFDGDGFLTIFDFLGFQTAFDAGDPRADLDGDGELTLFDFLEFQRAFDAGC